MLRNTQEEMKRYAIGATDGEIGHVNDLYFDDQNWVVRFLVVDTGTWLLSRKVLISPYCVDKADWKHKRLPVRTTRQQVRDSPDVDTQKPLSRQHQKRFADYYAHPYYWSGDGFWGDGLYMPVTPPLEGPARRPPEPVQEYPVEPDEQGDSHLRSCSALVGCHMHATDGDAGRISNMLVDETSWAIRYLVIDTSNWWAGQQVLIPPQWVTQVNWATSTARIKLGCQTIKSSPRYESSDQLNGMQEAMLHRHYGRLNDKERRKAPANQRR